MEQKLRPNSDPMRPIITHRLEVELLAYGSHDDGNHSSPFMAQISVNATSAETDNFYSNHNAGKIGAIALRETDFAIQGTEVSNKPSIFYKQNTKSYIVKPIQGLTKRIS